MPVTAHRPALLSHPAVLLATWFGTGYLRPAPGTWGTLGAVPVAWLGYGVGGTPALFGLAVATFVVGVWAAERFDRLSGGHDASEIVIDEAAGLFLTLAALSLVKPLGLSEVAAGFILFRLFDITKPPPVRQVDRHLGGGLGVMMDDILAAIYAAAVYWVGHMLFVQIGGVQ